MDKKQEDEYKWYHDNVDHTPMHPHHEWVVDRCADRCDDQLPLFSQVGRGLQGNGFKIVAEEDNDHTWTILKGYEIDPHTGQETEKWRTDNINGGKLTHKFLYNPTTNPKTFKIQFTLTRPNGLGWTDTTPAIPYLWDDEANVGVATLFVKKKGSPNWDQITISDSDTPHSISEAVGEFEKLIYPPLDVRSDYKMPQPGDPWTVNLEYGKGSDIDVPTTQEEEADIAAAKQQVLEHLHKDLGGGEGLPSVTEPSLKPLKGDSGTKTVWDWIIWARDQAIDAAKTHLHADLYGGDYSDIPDDLKPLMGDLDGEASVWDWIKWIKGMIDGIAAPQMYSKTLSNTYLVSIQPTPLEANTAVTPLCAIEAEVKIQYFDSLPNVIIDITPKNVAVDYQANTVYAGSNGIRLGTGEMAVICTKSGSSYKPFDLSTVTLENRSELRNTLTYPKVDPEILSNSGFGWAGYYNFTDNHGYRDRAGQQDSYTFSNRLYPAINSDEYEVLIDGSCYGNWELYSGIGNVMSTQNSRWNKNGSGVFAYIFNRTTGKLGTRVLLDYNRPYQVSYIQAR